MAREGYPNIAFVLGLTLILTTITFFNEGSLYWKIPSMLSGVLLLFTLYFFRDPEREVVINSKHILSPGDGVIVEIKDVEDDYVGDATLITMFLSPLNVHINRVPISGKIGFVNYKYGAFKAAFAEDASEVNEQSVVGMENDLMKVKFSQIAGAVARRIINYLREEDEVTQGDRYGLIKFGSRMDVVIPRAANILVEMKEPVRGGITILAKMD
ncbi:MAG: phosphatidylserine decarboxylase [Candidatus Marinimicrobia bacterium]|jgi:phosphatidylserine decarboxylase|nr:phosphatidylserine decarboxylase [Candidatus Neomarinimicrobiota bacterium]MBT4361573.1 phosphatidylserine decarboxylase [Candidatus Neomarinimicrobiota bacterium]MBT4714330.1 phosphatidylserine decarboxylase [Candidatus Neomarinimicrobiota bacterium]MBT4945574.1 phosphatidylserine decarboxylase [Candidatus Neomarinimicrobiota bacterium]MBT5271580.1 phosphatidylserine decarboxylase [Candidatus Neomarinimicrobiota bacterium]